MERALVSVREEARGAWYSEGVAVYDRLGVPVSPYYRVEDVGGSELVYCLARGAVYYMVRVTRVRGGRSIVVVKFRPRGTGDIEVIEAAEVGPSGVASLASLGLPRQIIMDLREEMAQ